MVPVLTVKMKAVSQHIHRSRERWPTLVPLGSCSSKPLSSSVLRSTSPSSPSSPAGSPANTAIQYSKSVDSCLCRIGTFRVAGAVVVPLVVLQQTLGLVPHLAVALVHHVPLHVLAAAEPLAPLPAPQTQVTLAHLPAQCLRAGKNGQCLTGRTGDLPSGHTNNTNISQNSMVNFRIHKK